MSSRPHTLRNIPIRSNVKKHFSKKCLQNQVLFVRQKEKIYALSVPKVETKRKGFKSANRYHCI